MSLALLARRDFIREAASLTEKIGRFPAVWMSQGRRDEGGAQAVLYKLVEMAPRVTKRRGKTRPEVAARLWNV